MSNEHPFRSSASDVDGVSPYAESLQSEAEISGQPVDSPSAQLHTGAASAGVESPMASARRVNRIGCPLIAWLIIAALVGLIASRPFIQPDEKQDQPSTGQPLSLHLMEIQAKYIVGLAEFPTVKSKDLYSSAKILNTGPLENRFRFVVLSGELSGAEEASEQLTRLNHRLEKNGTETTENQDEIRNALNGLYDDYGNQQWEAPSLTTDQRQLLQGELGWFGELALAPAGGAGHGVRGDVLAAARRVAIVLVLVGMGLFVLGSAGLFGLVTLIALKFSGTIQSRFRAGSNHGGVYAETFAVWMLLFVGLSIAASFLSLDQHAMLVNLFVSLLSLCAVGWPVIRGVSWRQARRDLGLELGKTPLMEPLWGAVCYVSTLPLLLIGVVIMFILMSIAGLLAGLWGVGAGGEFAATEVPSHPIVHSIAEAGWFDTLLIGLLACVVAPIVEEVMFRGVLYRHLRDVTARWRVTLSVLVSGAATSFIFAVIHPQGLLAVPALMALAIGFSLTREWRSSLLAPITMHGLNNGAVMLIMLAIF